MECLIAIGTWIGGKIADYTVGPVGHKLGYIFHCKRNVGNLLTETQDLNLDKTRMEDLVDVARRNGEEIHDHIKDWLSKVGDITKETEKLLGDENHTSVKCTFRESFQNLVQRYHLSRKAKKMGESVSKIKGEIRFDNISYRPRLQSNFRNKDFISFDTRKEIMTRIMEALKDGNIKMIGVYGMPGAGKTTLVKEIAREALEKRLFNDAILVTVSQTPNIKIIQQEIAEKLDLKVDKESISERAVLLQNRLKSEEKLLIILDDVWNSELNFQDLGILIDSDDQKGSKILLTSRFERVLHDDMGVEITFPLELVSEDEAWDLFSHIVGDLVKTADFQQHGKEIVKECACLPIAIVTIAHVLKNRDLPFWRDALGQLQRSNLNINGMHEKVYSRIKLCYDYLQNEEAKLLLLLCCLHKEGTSKNLEYLMRYGIGLDMFKGVRTLQEAKDRLYSLVDELKDHFLLLDDEDSRSVEMHDVICDVVRSIGKESHMYYFRDGTEVEEIRKRKTLKDARAISLPNGYVDGLICESFEYKQLEIIWMCKNKSLDIIPNSCFEKTKELRVLHFFSQNLEVLPSSLCFLQNLRTLCMHGCQLGDIALIGELRNLEILDLTESSITELPRQIGQLTRLRILDLSECEGLIVIHPNIISHLTRLEGLYMGDFKNWDKNVGVNGEIRNASLLELKHLVQLTSLHLQIPDIRMLPKPLFSEKLERYLFLIHLDDEEDQDDDNDDFDVNILFPRSSQYDENIAMQQPLFLTKFSFPKLEKLSLLRFHFVKIWDDPILLGSTSFRHLTGLKVDSCEFLRSLFSSAAIAASLKQLYSIEIRHCRMVEEIMSRNENLDKISFSKLNNLYLINLPNLVRFSSNIFVQFPLLTELFILDCPQFETFISNSEDNSCSTIPSLFDQKFVSSPKLEVLELSGCWSKKIWDDHVLPRSQSFSSLTRLIVVNCDMKILFSSVMVKSFGQLCSLVVRDCRILEETMGGNANMYKMSFPYLNHLELENLPNLLTFSSSNFIEFPMLTQLSIKDCPKFKTFISKLEENSCTTSISSLFNEKFVSFPGLENLELHGCNFTKIWDDQLILSSASFRKLRKLVVYRCKYLRNLFTCAVAASFEQLCFLDIRLCAAMVEIMSSNGSMDKISFPMLHSLALEKLPVLVTVTSAIFSEFPLLTELCIKDCPGFSSFISELDENWSTNANMLSPFKEKFVSFPNLEKLELLGCHLKKTWAIQLQHSFTFCNLTKLVVVECEASKNLFSYDMAASFEQLCFLEIRNCTTVEEIIISNNERMENLSFPKLSSLELENLPNLVTFSSSEIPIEFPLLTELSISDCPKFETFIPKVESLFNECVSFPILENLKLLGCHFTKIWDDGQLLLSSTSLCNLKEMCLGNCKFLKKLFSSAVALTFEGLENLEIRDCTMMEEIMSNNEMMDKVSFPKLKFLELENLPNLSTFSSAIFVEFPLLTSLRINGCPEFNSFISKQEKTFAQVPCNLSSTKWPCFPA
ncbi:disease resistance protein RPS2 [Ziziphus jujuba]|uniref:Disease resistance protein RPS2 n=1 Tax=Ziziphus jujuba TaxID=326968 RepID=A0ABM4AFC7_ZIZJJ|nr:disease resistance protein RPS2 [Ziziphus jujuba]